MVAQICVRVYHHASTTCVTNPVRKLSLLKNRLTVQIKFSCMIMMLKVHRNTSGQLRCALHILGGGDAFVLDVGPTMRILCHSHLRELAFI